MNHEELYESIQSLEASVASAIDHCRDSVTPVGGTEPGDTGRRGPASEVGAAGGDGPGEPDEAWFDDPDAHLEEVVDYMRRLHARCESSDEFVAALKGLFPDLEEKVAKCRALVAEDLGEDDVPDPDADIAAGRTVFYRSGAEMLAADLATISDPVVRA